MREVKHRGLNTKGEWVYGSLVIANSFIKHMPKQHTKTWIVTSAFGNGGWFNIRGRQYVKPETVGQFTGLVDINETEIYEGDCVICDDHDGFIASTSLSGVVKFLGGSFGVLDDKGGFNNLALTCAPNVIVSDNIHKLDIEF